MGMGINNEFAGNQPWFFVNMSENGSLNKNEMQENLSTEYSHLLC